MGGRGNLHLTPVHHQFYAPKKYRNRSCTLSYHVAELDPFEVEETVLHLELQLLRKHVQQVPGRVRVVVRSLGPWEESRGVQISGSKKKLTLEFYGNVGFLWLIYIAGDELGYGLGFGFQI